MKWVRTFLWIILFLSVILFSLHNKEEVILRFSLHPLQSFLWESPKIPLFLVILCSVFLGIIIGGISDLYRHIQLKKTLRQNQRMIERLEREIQSLSAPRGGSSSLIK